MSAIGRKQIFAVPFKLSAASAVRDHSQWRVAIMLLGVFGASPLYGDAVFIWRKQRLNFPIRSV